MNTYANVSKKLIVQALGRQGNYKEILTDKIDVENSGCLNCPYYLKNNGQHDKEGSCSNCPTRQFIIETKYINEKNRYRVDDTLRLKVNAIKLLLYFHFLNPDSNGIIKNINTKDIAEKLNVSHKTIWNNINLLCDYGYIYWCKSYKGLINILIQGYKEQKEKNGPGYIVVNDEWMGHIMKCDNINTLRIMIRETLNIDNQNTTGYFFNTKETSYENMRRYLPSYCKRFIIKNVMEKAEDIISGVFETYIKDNTIRFTLKDSCLAKKRKDMQLKENERLLREFLKEYNENINLSLTDKVEDVRFAYLNEETRLVPSFSITGNETVNLAHLALTYGLEAVKEALFIVHRHYIAAGLQVKNIGGLVRTIMDYSKAYTA